ncbi:unnamed protein product, partial [Larinioides sclopetarius]
MSVRQSCDTVLSLKETSYFSFLDTLEFFFPCVTVFFCFQRTKRVHFVENCNVHC